MHCEPEDIAIVKDILQRVIPKHTVWAFGSRVHGKHLKEFSDLDLAIIADQPLDLKTFTN